MCGIVGAVSNRNIVPILVQGLQRLEYRGYDSCGVAVNAAQSQMGQAAGLQRARSTERVAELVSQVNAPTGGLQGTTGIAHTRWATHGAPAVHNAHPHFSPGPSVPAGEGKGRIGLVHNGIIENH
jgi:glucosamine--fructose-6-phosphate aminotransferase (isomerizing)